MNIQRPARIVFALGIIGLGVLGAVYGDFASGWPAWVPWRAALLHVATGVMLAGGAGLLFERTASVAARLLLPYLLLWMSLRIPALLKAPLVEVTWLAVGEVAVLAAAAWALVAALRGATGERGRWFVRALFGLSLVSFGLSHFIYLHETVSLVPAWLPFRTGWAYLTGTAHTAAGLGVLLSVYPRLAASMEAAMLTTFTALVWVPAIMSAHAARNDWSEFVLSGAISAAAFVVAGSFAKD